MKPTTTYYCPCCGQPMDAITCTFEFPHGNKHIVQVTCYIEGCAFKTYTISPERANNPTTLLNTYHVERQFDVYTGESVNE